MTDPFILGIPTLNRHDLLRECVDSALAGTRPPHLVYVVDNGGGFAHPDHRVRVLSPPENLGVARSWNLLHKIAGRLPLLISNDDVRFAPDTCEAALATPGPFVAICAWACFLQREECWRAVGEYDEQFWPAYFEDGDYHYRMRLAGLDYVVPSGGAVAHAGSATLRSLPDVHRHTVVHHFDLNRDYYVRKWGGLPGRERYRRPFDGQALPAPAAAGRPEGAAEVSHDSIEAMYPPVPVALLVSDEWQARFREYFIESGELGADPFEVAGRTTRPERNCIAVSLFKRHAGNRRRDEFAVDERYWRTKYWDGILGVVREITDFPGWKIRVYLEPELWDLIPTILVDHPRVEWFRMKEGSVGASPGALWRYLALADRSLDYVLVTDIDEPLRGKEAYIRSFEADGRSSVARFGGFTSDRGYLVAPGESRAKNYATVLGGRVMSRPRRWDFDPAAAMRGFMAYRRFMALTDRPWRYADAEPSSAYNEPVDGHVYGWGSHWYMYCFDERFLKHVVYYHFAEKGALHTWASDRPPLSPEGARDLRYVHARGNTTACPHSGVPLVP